MNRDEFCGSSCREWLTVQMIKCAGYWAVLNPKLHRRCQRPAPRDSADDHSCCRGRDHRIDASRSRWLRSADPEHSALSRIPSHSYWSVEHVRAENDRVRPGGALVAGRE